MRRTFIVATLIASARSADPKCTAEEEQSLLQAGVLKAATGEALDVERAAAVTPSQALGDWDGTSLALTHYWDCSGQGCDAATLQPWNQDNYVSPPGYGPQDPGDHGGSVYGESLWLTGAANDALSALLGDDDACCGADADSRAQEADEQTSQGVGGCGKCLLIENTQAVNNAWTAVVMKKNRCPPWTNGCGGNTPHMDIAAPGFDNLAYSTANVCGAAGTGFDTQVQSEALGSWYDECAHTGDCAYKCCDLPAQFQKGCDLFAQWGWTTGSPDAVKYRVVDCPQAFKDHIQGLFDATGPVDSGSSVSPIPSCAPPAPAPAPESASPIPSSSAGFALPLKCEGYEASGCEWTNEWSCPGQPAGSGGTASDDGSLGYRCCCDEGAWKAPCCSWDPWAECGSSGWCQKLKSNCEMCDGGQWLRF